MADSAGTRADYCAAECGGFCWRCQMLEQLDEKGTE